MATEEPKELIMQKEIQHEMKDAYLEYAMSVIVARALPDVRDGLKPVHRRILYGMYDLGMFHNKPFKKSARIVGEILGKYHPHGDLAVYDSMVRMAQDFSLRYPLIDGQGNFGSIDGDAAAAHRYTEARLQKIAELLLDDLEKETVKFSPNFDGSLTEPSVLPGKIPNLLMNGASGIAVGMATNMPPHNNQEICEGIIHLIDHPDATPLAIADIVKGPDFPTGGVILGTRGIKEAQLTGRGKITIRARHHLEEMKDHDLIIIDEIPYMVNKSMLLEQIADLVKDKVIQGISDIRDESDREGMRMVFTLKKGTSTEIVLNQLFSHSRLQVTFGIINLALVDNQPKILSTLDLMHQFILHRKIVVRKRTHFDCKKAKEQAHILEGLLIALANIDPIVALIKRSNNVQIAQAELQRAYTLTEIQAKSILEMRLSRLTSLEHNKIKEECARLLILISELETILADEGKILSIIKDELRDIEKIFGDPRKTEILPLDDDTDFHIEDLIADAAMVVTITHSGYVKRLPVETYKQQGRGGKGIIGTSTKEEDFVKQLFIASAHSALLFFTESGQVHWLKVYEIPEATRQSLGKAIINLISTPEKISAVLAVKDFKEDNYFVMITRQGTIKRICASEFSRPRRGGIRAITLDQGDTLVDVVLADGHHELLIATANGIAVRCDENDIRPIGRTGKGVRGIHLEKNDEVIGMILGTAQTSVLTVTEKGYGKRTPIEEYRLINRGGKGVINFKITDKTGKVVAISSVQDEDDIMLISQKGIIIRTTVKEISEIGRNTQGVRVMKIEENDSLVACAKILHDNGNSLPHESPKVHK